MGEMIFSQIIAVGVTDVVAAMMIWMLSVWLPNLLPGLICFCVQCAIIVVLVIVMHRTFFRTHPPKKAKIVYDVRHGIEGLISAYGLDKRYEVLGSYAVEDVIAAPENKLSDAEYVFMCGIRSHERNILLKYCIGTDKCAFMIPRVGDVLMSGAEQMHMFHLPFMRVIRYKPPMEYRILKRAFDIVLSGIALVLL